MPDGLDDHTVRLRRHFTRIDATLRNAPCGLTRNDTNYICHVLRDAVPDLDLRSWTLKRGALADVIEVTFSGAIPAPGVLGVSVQRKDPPQGTIMVGDHFDEVQLKCPKRKGRP